MDSERFDALAVALSRMTTRRRTIRGIVAALSMTLRLPGLDPPPSRVRAVTKRIPCLPGNDIKGSCKYLRQYRRDCGVRDADGKYHPGYKLPQNESFGADGVTLQSIQHGELAETSRESGSRSRMRSKCPCFKEKGRERAVFCVRQLVKTKWTILTNEPRWLTATLDEEVCCDASCKKLWDAYNVDNQRHEEKHRDNLIQAVADENRVWAAGVWIDGCSDKSREGGGLERALHDYKLRRDARLLRSELLIHRIGGEHLKPYVDMPGCDGPCERKKECRRCKPDGSGCEDADGEPCGGVSCGGATCKGGVCKTEPGLRRRAAASGVCCPAGETPCGDDCCSADESCIAGNCCADPCGDGCCAADETCQNGSCCATPCGESCCNTGQACTHRENGRCCPVCDSQAEDPFPCCRDHGNTCCGNDCCHTVADDEHDAVKLCCTGRDGRYCSIWKNSDGHYQCCPEETDQSCPITGREADDPPCCPAGTKCCHLHDRFSCIPEHEECKCATKCRGGELCCLKGELCCTDECVPGDTVDDCGRCGNVCEPDRSSTAAEIGYPLCCDGQCVSYRSRQHCGRCGNACAIDEVCCATATTATCESLSSGSHCGRCFNRCDDGQVCCGGACASLASHPNHCGECNNRCGDNQFCCEGRCMSSNDDDCGACGRKCLEGTVCCNGSCVDLTGAGNCGACGETCQGGHCCGGSCVPMSELNCGGCGDQCPSGYRCCKNECVLAALADRCGYCGDTCPSGYTCCGDTCTKLQSDVRHCGACANSCRQGQHCCAGRCIDADRDNCEACGRKCPAGAACCGKTCTSLTSVLHCGACFDRCLEGQMCCRDKNREHRCLERCGSCDKTCRDNERCKDGKCVAIE